MSRTPDRKPKPNPTKPKPGSPKPGDWVDALLKQIRERRK